MKIGEILLKSSPVPTKREMSQSEYNKLVDANAKLMDKIKLLEKKYTIMKENAETFAKRIDKAIEYIEKEKAKDEEDNFIDLYLDKYENDLLDILKGSDKE